MPRLDETSDLGVLAVIHAVREIADPDLFGPVALTEMARLVPSDVLSFNEVDPISLRLGVLVEPDTYVIPPGRAETLSKYAYEHPLIEFGARTGDGSARG